MNKNQDEIINLIGFIKKNAPLWSGPNTNWVPFLKILIEGIESWEEKDYSKTLNHYSDIIKNLHEQNMLNYEFEKFLEVYQVERRFNDLTNYFKYQSLLKSFNSAFEKSAYDLAYRNYYSIIFAIQSISDENKAILLDEKEKKALDCDFQIVMGNLSKQIKKKILEMGTKFTRLQINEIQEKCGVNDENLIIEVAKTMISNKEIYAEYFSSSKSIAFNQQANVDEIDMLMKKFKEWEKETKSL